MMALGPRELGVEFRRLCDLDAQWRGEDDEVREALVAARSIAETNAWGLPDDERRRPGAPTAAELDARTQSLRPIGVCGFFDGPEHTMVLSDGEAYAWQQTQPRRDPVRQLLLEPGALLVVGGPPGVGKTHLVERLDLGGAQILCPDRIRDELVGLDAQEINGATLMGELMDRLEGLLDEGVPTVLSAPALKRRMLRAYSRAAVTHGRPLHVLYLDGDRRLCDEGQAQRDRKLPDEVLDDYVSDWTFLKEGLLKPVHPDTDAGARLMREGYRSVSVMGRAAADTLESLRFG